jgi:quinohemoprotein ethanol dehydrogenase
MGLALVLSTENAAAETLPDLGWTENGRTSVADYYSPLASIDSTNVQRLGLAWEFDDFVVRGGVHRGMEATPLVVDGIMYFSGPWSVVYALDAANGRSLWKFDPGVHGEFNRRACCDVVNRGVAVQDGVLYVGTLDGYLAAVDAKTGRPVWKVDTLIDRSRSYTITGAPRIAGPLILIGNSGAEMGVRGYVSAYDLKTGKLIWRFYCVPAAPGTEPETDEMSVARKTWSPNSRWDLGGGGTPWDSIVYDAKTNLVFVGTGNGMPHPASTRSPGGGDNLYLSSIVALDASTGRLRWFYQTTPGDSWDYTATQNMILADLTIEGKLRHVLMQAPKNGFFYVLDRETGQLLSAQKYTTVTWADGVDAATGRPKVNPQSDFSSAPKLIWPSEAGGHDWQPMAYSPQTGLVYIPVLEAPMIFRMYPQPYSPYSAIQGSAPDFPPFAAEDHALLAGQPKPALQSVLKAWDPVRQTAAWVSKPAPYWNGGALATAGGIVIEGGADGYLSIYEARHGQVIGRINVGTGIMAAPMTYAIKGQQYVAVLAGFGGAMAPVYPAGSVALTRQNTERLLVFKLGGGAVRLPGLRTAAAFVPVPTKFRGSSESVARGSKMFNERCGICHGGKDTIGAYPNLWSLTPAIHDAFAQIVLDGVLSDLGMASFSDVLSKSDVVDIHAYIESVSSAATTHTQHRLH